MLAPLAGAAPTPAQPARVGVVFNYPPASQFEGTVPANPNARAFRDELARLGWTPGRNVEILWRSWEGDSARMPGIVRELLQRRVDVLVLFGNPTVAEARRQTRSVPIVMGASSDPADSGLVESLARPGGNVTGLTLDSDGRIFGKRLALLRELVPGLARVAYITSGAGRRSDASVAAQSGMTLLPYRVTRAGEVDAALADARREHAGAALLDDGAAFSNPEPQALIGTFAVRHRMPLMNSWLHAEGAGVLAYGSRGVDFRRVAEYVDRILKGAKPADLPIHQPDNYFLYVNLKAARAIGLEVPASLLARADQVIR